MRRPISAKYRTVAGEPLKLLAVCDRVLWNRITGSDTKAYRKQYAKEKREVKKEYVIR